MAPTPVQLAGKDYQQLLAKLADPKMDRTELWQEILAFLATNPSTYLADRAQHFFLKLPSPLDALDAKEIPAAERYPWQPQELVAVIGNHAKRHWGAVHAMAYHPGGKFVAVGGDDGIRLWDADTFKEITRIADDKCLDRALTFSADGNCWRVARSATASRSGR